MLTSRLSFFGIGGSNKVNNLSDGIKSELAPTIKLQTNKDVYRPGDSIFVTIEISNPNNGALESTLCSLLIEKLGFEIKGIEKLDPQWFATQKPLPGSRQRIGEHVFMDCSTSSMVSNQILSSGATKTYVVRAVLPSIIPPSYRGATIRYLYYVKGALSGRWLILENGHSHTESSKDLIELETRVPLQIWATQKSNGLLMEEGRSDGFETFYQQTSNIRPDIWDSCTLTLTQPISCLFALEGKLCWHRITTLYCQILEESFLRTSSIQKWILPTDQMDQLYLESFSNF